jgi:hypothetical protein
MDMLNIKKINSIGGIIVEMSGSRYDLEEIKQ